jgi:hypothetical protein
MESGEVKSWSFSAKGFFERSIPVMFAYSPKASMISWRLEEEIVGCSIEDMEARDGDRPSEWIDRETGGEAC